MPKPSRNLSFRDRWLSELTEIVSEDIDPGNLASFSDQTTQEVLITSWSQEEYTRILASLEVGAALAYPELRQQIYYDFLKVMNAMIVDCDDVADCIDTSEAVANAIINQLTARGFTPNPESAPSATPVQLTPEQTANNMLAGVTDCSEPAHNMAIARAIVRELHETVQDVFENLELATNANEAAGIVVGALPAAGAGAAVIEMVDWVQETVVETYQAAYNQSAEDTIACAIFCHLETDCEISLDTLLSIYEELGSITVPAIETFDDLINFIVTTTMSIDVTGVAIFHYFLLHALKFGGAVFELAGFNDLVYVIKNAAQVFDYSYDQCDDCPPAETPDNFWRLYQDFSNGLGQFTVVTGTAQADGVMGATSGGNSTVTVEINDFGAGYQIQAYGTMEQRRGSDGNGTNDRRTNNVYPNTNQGGAAFAVLNQGFITCNTNDCSGQNVLVSPTSAMRSLQSISSVQGAHLYPSNFVKLLKVVIYGLPGAGSTKPPGSVWVNAVPAVGDLFP